MSFKFLARHSNNQQMLAQIYVKALLVDPVSADLVWDLWNAGVITDEKAEWAWWLTVNVR